MSSVTRTHRLRPLPGLQDVSRHARWATPGAGPCAPRRLLRAAAPLGVPPAKQSGKCITEPGRLPRDLTYAHGTGSAAALRTPCEDTVEPPSPQREARAYLRPLRHAPSGLTDARLAHVTQLVRERTGSGSGSVSCSAGPRPLPHPSQRAPIQRSNFSLYHGKIRFNFLNINSAVTFNLHHKEKPTRSLPPEAEVRRSLKNL